MLPPCLLPILCIPIPHIPPPCVNLPTYCTNVGHPSSGTVLFDGVMPGTSNFFKIVPFFLGDISKARQDKAMQSQDKTKTRQENHKTITPKCKNITRRDEKKTSKDLQTELYLRARREAPSNNLERLAAYLRWAEKEL